MMKTMADIFCSRAKSAEVILCSNVMEVEVSALLNGIVGALRV